MAEPFTLVPTVVPAGNIRVPLRDFEVLYAELMVWHDDPQLPFDAYVHGVEAALAWVAGRSVIEDGKSIYPRPPVSDLYRSAAPETIADELRHAARQLAHHPESAYTRGVIDAFEWCWLGSGRRPLPAGWLDGFRARRRA